MINYRVIKKRFSDDFVLWYVQVKVDDKKWEYLMSYEEDVEIMFDDEKAACDYVDFLHQNDLLHNVEEEEIVYEV